MSVTADAAANRAFPGRLGLHPGQVVQELGWDEDVPDELRDAIMSAIDGELLPEDNDEVVDVVVLWWREGEGDLTDALLDTLVNLADAGMVLFFTPKAGLAGHTSASDVTEAALVAGLHGTTTVVAGDKWSATRLTAPKSNRK
ncbi:MAG: DUF3052 domain-containing protein [Actinomycetota bacterium]